jgi:hypothetical protein
MPLLTPLPQAVLMEPMQAPFFVSVGSVSVSGSSGSSSANVSGSVKVVLKGYRIRRASASAHTLCPFPEYSPLFQNTILIVSEDPDGYCSVSEGPDDYRMISGCRDKYRIPIRR